MNVRYLMYKLSADTSSNFLVKSIESSNKIESRGKHSVTVTENFLPNRSQ